MLPRPWTHVTVWSFAFASSLGCSLRVSHTCVACCRRGRKSFSVMARRMPRPPPPAVALIMTGKPTLRDTSMRLLLIPYEAVAAGHCGHSCCLHMPNDTLCLVKEMRDLHCAFSIIDSCQCWALWALQLPVHAARCKAPHLSLIQPLVP